MSKRLAAVNRKACVACGACTKVCPRQAIDIHKGCYAAIHIDQCVGCGKCANVCPAGCIVIKEREKNEE